MAIKKIKQVIDRAAFSQNLVQRNFYVMKSVFNGKYLY